MSDATLKIGTPAPALPRAELPETIKAAPIDPSDLAKTSVRRKFELASEAASEPATMQYVPPVAELVKTKVMSPFQLPAAADGAGSPGDRATNPGIDDRSRESIEIEVEVEPTVEASVHVPITAEEPMRRSAPSASFLWSAAIAELLRKPPSPSQRYRAAGLGSRDVDGFAGAAEPLAEGSVGGWDDDAEGAGDLADEASALDASSADLELAPRRSFLARFVWTVVVLITMCAAAAAVLSIQEPSIQRSRARLVHVASDLARDVAGLLPAR